MGEIFLGILLTVVGIIVGAFVISDGLEFEHTLGTTYSELSRMKEECEHSLPRNQQCIASIIFLPTASEE